MKGQVALEELISLAAYLAILSILCTAILGMQAAGEEWGTKASLKSKAISQAQLADAYCNSNIYNPYPRGSGTGYMELENGNAYANSPVLCGFEQNEKAEGT